MAKGLQQTLSALNRRRLSPTVPEGNPVDQWAKDYEAMLLEYQFLERDRQRVAQRAALAPPDPLAFATWFDGLKNNGPGQHDPLFEFLAEHASFAQLRWFMQQEVAGEAGFEDLVALTQLRMPEQAKLELARNYWDEMGRGKPAAMHGPMLATLADALGVQDPDSATIAPEALALSNVLVGLAYNRRYAYHALGALGAIELTAPTRAVKLVEAFDRLGIDRAASHYFRVHAVVDLAHAQTWPGTSPKGP
jgi:hypothetical protein